MKIVVLAGGLSPERDVSLTSGSLIANALIENGHKVLLLDVYEGIDTEQNNFDKLFIDKNSNNTYKYSVGEGEPDLEILKLLHNNGNSLIGKNVLEICKTADKVFIALHGSIGENGQIQAVFDCLGIQYTGSGYIGSLLAMDKDIAKKIALQSNILTAHWINFNVKTDSLNNMKDMKFPLVVKPCSCGSSVGVSIVNNESELKTAIIEAKEYEELIIIEEFIKGREFSIGIINNNTLPPIEIIPKDGFYDYKNKYQAGFTTEICPADLTKEETETISKIALKAHNALRLGYYSRIDFILAENGEFYFLEANTLPGMTPTSLLPQEAKTVEISFNELCEKITIGKM